MGKRKAKRKQKIVREFSAGGVVYKKFKVPRPRQAKPGTVWNLAKRGGQNSLRAGPEAKFKILWLVTKSTPSKISPKGFWRLPKGWLDDEPGGKRPGPLARGERKAKESELQQAALSEVYEEGGVKVKIVSKIGTERYFRGRGTLKFVTFYLTEWVKDLPEGPSWETEEVLWLPYDKARQKLKHEGEKRVLDKAKEVLESGTQGVLV